MTRFGSGRSSGAGDTFIPVCAHKVGVAAVAVGGVSGPVCGGDNGPKSNTDTPVGGGNATPGF